MSARQFGRDSGDTYGRHALVNPGGDNRQRDVMHVLYPERYALHPTCVTENYVGTHRDDGNSGAITRMMSYGGQWALARLAPVLRAR